MTKTSPVRGPLFARVPRLALGTVKRDWLGGQRAGTHLSNAMHLLFPAGERFFVRSVLHYRRALPPDLAAQVKAFCQQEGRHAQAHERFFDNLRAQGQDIDGILERYERAAFGAREKQASPALRLAITAALEHLTALFAADALSRDALLATCDPEMRRLLEWHAVEELEHKAVAFDILRTVAPGYALRTLGLALAALSLGYFWATTARALLANDGLGVLDVVRDVRSAEAPLVDTRAMLAGLRDYLRPDFHPNDVDHGPLIAATLARLDAEGVFAPG
jgi:uncharacterized protein